MRREEAILQIAEEKARKRSRLRAQAAIAAMQGILASGIAYESVSRVAVQYADNLLVALEKEKPWPAFAVSSASSTYSSPRSVASGTLSGRRKQ